ARSVRRRGQSGGAVSQAARSGEEFLDQAPLVARVTERGVGATEGVGNGQEEVGMAAAAELEKLTHGKAPTGTASEEKRDVVQGVGVALRNLAAPDDEGAVEQGPFAFLNGPEPLEEVRDFGSMPLLPPAELLPRLQLAVARVAEG